MDKKICTFIQTYGDERFELFDYYPNDNNLINFMNMFDTNVFSFHNSSPEYINKAKESEFFKKLKNLEFKEYHNIDYMSSFRKTLQSMLDDGYNYIFYLQDDTFTCGNEYDLTDLFEFVKTQNFNILYLEATGEDLNNQSIYYEKNDLKIYNTTTQDFFNRNGWAMDDGAHISNIQYLLDNVYTDDYFKLTSIHDGEGFLNRKFSKFKMERLTTNLRIVRRYNILGPNAHWNGENDRKILKKLFT